MLTLYRLLTLLLTPLALLRLQRGAPGRGRWGERLGWIGPLDPGRIWIHAASVGEVNAVHGLIQSLLDRGERLLLSTMTGTGAERARTLFGERVEHRFIALDNPLATRAWLAQARPRLGLIVETEIWPELFLRCARAGIPLVMVNARLSAAAFARYRRLRALFVAALKPVVLAVCQTELDAERWQQLGLDRSKTPIAGNLKFDQVAPHETAQRSNPLPAQLGNRPVWTAGSTRPGEERLLLEAHRRVLDQIPEALLVLAPRHPERSAEVAGLIDSAGLSRGRIDDAVEQSIQVVLVDRIGVLLDCYAAATASFVGGSLVPLGGHNLLEPAALGKPVLAGPHLANQAEAAGALQQTGGLTVVGGPQALADALISLLGDAEQARDQGRRALQALAAGSGSLQRTLDLLDPWLNGPSSQD